MSKNVDFALLPAAQYYEALQKAIAKAKQRIVIHAMVVAWTPGMDKLAPLISDALDRGVRVDIVGDRYTRLFLSVWGRFSRKPGGPGSWQHTPPINQKLIEKGAHITYIERVKPQNPFAGRCHSKAVVIDDTVFSFGGINFGDQDLRGYMPNNDFMLRTTNKALADYIHQLVRTLAEDKGILPDYQHPIDGQTTLLFDGGAPKESIIYDTACRLAARAQRIYYVSQYPPSGRLGYLVSQKENVCYFNRVGKGDFPMNVMLLLDKLRYRLANRYQKSPYLHAKFILTEEADGTKNVITGSNNFSWSGVQFGTKEIAIHSTNEKLWQILYNYIEETIA